MAGRAAAQCRAIDRHGDLKADTDAQQLVYEMYGLILALHHDARFLRVPGSIERAQAGFIRLLASYQNCVTSK